MTRALWSIRTFAFDNIHLCRLARLVLLVSEMLGDEGLDHRFLVLLEYEIIKSGFVCSALKCTVLVGRTVEALATGIELSEVGNVELCWSGEVS